MPFVSLHDEIDITKPGKYFAVIDITKPGKYLATMVHLLNGILAVNVLTDKKSQSCGAMSRSQEELKEMRKNMYMDVQILLWPHNHNHRCLLREDTYLSYLPFKSINLKQVSKAACIVNPP